MTTYHLPEFERVIGDLFGTAETYGARITWNGKVHACRPARNITGQPTGSPICGARPKECRSEGAALDTDDAIDCAACLREVK